MNGKGGLLWTVKSGKSLDLQGSASPQPGRLVSFIIRPENGPLTVHKTRYDKHSEIARIHQPEKAFSFTRLPNFLFEAPTFQPLSNEAKVLYAFVLRRAELSRKNGWADEYGRVYLYYPICEVVALLRCGRQKAVNTLRELQYAGLVEIQKQGCGKPNRIYPKSYEAVPNTDFKKSGYGTPEG